MLYQLTQPDGSRLSLGFAESRNLDPWQSQVHVDSPTDGKTPDLRRRRTFHVTHLGNYDYMIQSRFTERESITQPLGSGHVTLYRSADPEATQALMLWRGAHHEVQTYLPTEVADRADLAFDYLAGLEFNDTSEGLQLFPTDGSRDVVRMQESFTYIAELASLTVHPAALGLRFVPDWKGAAVPAGELWRSEDVTQPPHLILASATCVCVLQTVESGSKSVMADRISRTLQLARSLTTLAVEKG